MAKTITITYENRDYTLEYTRDTVRVMEASGFIADELFVKPMLRLPELFFGAFAAHHRGLKKNVTDKIWESLPKRDELVVALVDAAFATQIDLALTPVLSALLVVLQVVILSLSVVMLRQDALHARAKQLRRRRRQEQDRDRAAFDRVAQRRNRVAACA